MPRKHAIVIVDSEASEADPVPSEAESAATDADATPGKKKRVRRPPNRGDTDNFLQTRPEEPVLSRRKITPLAKGIKGNEIVFAADGHNSRSQGSNNGKPQDMTKRKNPPTRGATSNAKKPKGETQQPEPDHVSDDQPTPDAEGKNPPKSKSTKSTTKAPAVGKAKAREELSAQDKKIKQAEERERREKESQKRQLEEFAERERERQEILDRERIEEKCKLNIHTFGP